MKNEKDRSTKREGLDGVLSGRAADIGQRLARKVFERRGNHTEAHMSELELAALLSLAAELGRKDPNIGQAQVDAVYPKKSDRIGN